jgi:hypothetical protein
MAIKKDLGEAGGVLVCCPKDFTFHSSLLLASQSLEIHFTKKS